VPIQAARTDAAADAWIAREQPKPGEPLAARVQADTDLSPAEKATTLAKIEARDSAQESARIAAVKGLDDRLGATAGTLATQPAAYRPGTLAAIANAYDDAGEADKADSARRMALQESFLRSFATSNVSAQQRLTESLPEGEDRTFAEAIQARQNEAFARDAFSAGTALYPDVGPPKPIDDLAGRIAQARAIAAYRGIPVAPFTADEIATMRQRLTDGTPQQSAAVLTLVNSLPEDMKGAIVPARMMSDAVDEPRRDGDQLAEATSDDYRELGPPPRSGVAPPIEPPSNDLALEKDFERWDGRLVRLPDGNLVSDPYSPNGQLMSPFSDLSDVAAEGRRVGAAIRERLMKGVLFKDVRGIKEYAEEEFRKYIGQGGTFDYQRRKYQFGKDGLTQLRQFRDVSNFNVGLFSHQAGLPLVVTLELAGRYAGENSSNYRPDQPYGLDPQTRELIERGYEAGKSGVFNAPNKH
jgi:hypothetical protein